jgi:hypothetical protein
MWFIVIFPVLVAAIVAASYLSWMHSGGVAAYIEEKSQEFTPNCKFPWM